MKMNQQILDYIVSHQDEHMELLTTLAQIPAPSGFEEKRAAFCKEWLENVGAKGVYIDEALNVVYPVGVTENNPLYVFAAHSDVVFPDTEPLPLKIEDGKIYCPGIGDDTAPVAAMLMCAKYITENNLQPTGCGVLIVVNSCEEGLGNLKGTRKLMEVFGDRVEEFITFDGGNTMCVNQAVGSKRYRVEIDTEGGHSYGAFGNRNAIAYLASLIDTLYTMKVPPIGKTTYNVGIISGGTSVNTIAQHAEMLYEFRSDEREALAIMEKHFNAAIDFYRTKGITVTVTLVGDRPCTGDVDKAKLEALMARASEANDRYFDKKMTYKSGSTDANIPLSLGIPAVCLGSYTGAGAHTRGEYVKLDSLLPGMNFTFDMMLQRF